MQVKQIIIPIPTAAAMSAKTATKVSLQTPNIRNVLCVSVRGKQIIVEVDSDETQPSGPCDWFVVPVGQIRPASGLIRDFVRANGRWVRVASTCLL